MLVTPRNPNLKLLYELCHLDRLCIPRHKYDPLSNDAHKHKVYFAYNIVQSFLTLTIKLAPFSLLPLL